MEFKPSFIVQPKKTSVNKVDFITQTVQFNWPVKMAPIWMMLTGCGNWVNAWLDSLHDLKIISNQISKCPSFFSNTIVPLCVEIVNKHAVANSRFFVQKSAYPLSLFLAWKFKSWFFSIDCIFSAKILIVFRKCYRIYFSDKKYVFCLSVWNYKKSSPKKIPKKSMWQITKNCVSLELYLCITSQVHLKKDKRSQKCGENRTVESLFLLLLFLLLLSRL